VRPARARYGLFRDLGRWLIVVLMVAGRPLHRATPTNVASRAIKRAESFVAPCSFV
jgi:hypothetical protein